MKEKLKVGDYVHVVAQIAYIYEPFDEALVILNKNDPHKIIVSIDDVRKMSDGEVMLYTLENAK